MKRRSFLKNTISASVISLGGITAFQFYQQSQLEMPDVRGKTFTFLTEPDLIVLQVLVPVFVTGLALNKNSTVNVILENIDQAIIRLPIRTQTELRELFDLLGSALGRVMLANVWLNWQKASSESVAKFLTEWRNSRMDLLKIAYKGLHKLIIGSVYSEAHNWSQLGYSGPPQFALSELDQTGSGKHKVKT